MSQATEIWIEEERVGRNSPFKVTWGKLMMWIFLVSDALTFGALLISLGFMRNHYGDKWPRGEEVFVHFPFLHEHHLPLLYVGLMTFLLIVSSVTMVLAVEAGHRHSKKEVAIWLFLTICGGLFFLCSQAWEWYNFIMGKEINGVRFYATPYSNPYGPPQYAAFFFTITGFHGFHVFTGVVINAVVLWLVLKGYCDKRGNYMLVENAGLYWHFVDLVWVFVFTFFYLI